MIRTISTLLISLTPWVSVCFASTLDSFKFKVESEGYILAAEILKTKSDRGAMPAIIFLVGSGGTSSHQTNYKDFVQFFFEESTLSEHFALVHFDKRGVGASEGTWFNTTFEERALDAKNVALALQEFDFIDKNQIWVIGHSQGGWIAQVAVANYPEIFAGGISMAGPTFGVRKQLVNDYWNKFICNKGYNENKALRKAEIKAKRDFLFVSIFGYQSNWKQLKVIKKFEPKAYIQSINKPFLFMLGENDALVSSTWCLDELSTIFPMGIPVHIQTYQVPEATHSFKLASICFKGKSSEYDYSSSTQLEIFKWLSSQKNGSKLK